MKIDLKSFWMAVSAIAIVVAAALMVMHDLSAAFVVAAIGLVAWFLSYRAQMKALIVSDEADNDRKQVSEETDED